MPIPSLLKPSPPVLYLGTEGLVWYEYRRVKAGVRDHRVLAESHEGDAEAALGRLIARAKPRHSYVITHVEPEATLTHVIPIPPVSEDEWERWLAAQIRAHTPEGFAEDALVWGTHLIGPGGDDGESDYAEGDRPPRLLLCGALRERVEYVHALLETHGLRPARLYAIAPCVGYAFLGDERFSSDHTLVRWERGFEARYAKGIVESVRYAPQPTELATFLVEEPHAELLYSALNTDPGSDGAAGVTTACADVPRALALADRFAGLPQVDFLSASEDEVSASEDEQASVALDRLGARRVMALSLALFALVFGATGGYALWARHAEASARQAVEARIPDLRALERAEARIAEREKGREAARAFAQAKSRTAAWMDAAARSTPPGVHLSGFDIQVDSLGAVGARVRGEARTETLIGVFADRLHVLGVAAEVLYAMRASQASRGEEISRGSDPQVGTSGGALLFELSLTGTVEAGP